MTSAKLDAATMEHRYLSPATRIPFFSLEVERANGVHFSDADGREFLDFHAMACIANVGHNHPRVVEAIRRQSDRLIVANSGYVVHRPLLELAARLAALPPGDSEYRVAFGLSGSDANDGALKLARAATGRSRAIAFIGSYHGNTYGALSLSAVDLNMRRGFGPEVPGIHHVPYPDVYRMPGTPDEIAQDCLDAIKTAFATTAPPDEVAAVFVEPIQGDSGIIVPPGRFLTELSSLCAEHGILLVAEEVQTGIGRTGRWLAGEHFGIRPDIVLLGKALASGLPVSAIVARSELMDAWKAPGHVFCTGANPVCCAAALATLDVIEEEALLHNAEVRGAELRAGLLELQARHEVIGDVRGVGLLLGVDLVKDRSTRERATDLAPQVLLGCFRRGLFLTYLGKCVLRLVPPLIITSDDVARALEILDASLTDAVEGRIHPEETEAIVGW